MDASSFSACAQEICRAAVHAADYVLPLLKSVAVFSTAPKTLLALFAAFLGGSLLKRRFGFDTTPATDTAAHGFSQEQHDLVGAVFPHMQKERLLRYRNPATGETLTFMTSPLGFGVVGLVPDPLKPGRNLVLLAESPDPILKLLGYPPGSYDEDNTSRRVYVLGIKDATQHPRAYLEKAVFDAFYGKTIVDIGAANLVAGGTDKEKTFQSGMCRVALAETDSGNGPQSRLMIGIAPYGNKKLVKNQKHPTVLETTLPPGLTQAEAEKAAHITFLQMHHKSKEELAGLRHRKLREAMANAGRELVSDVKHDLGVAWKNKNPLVVALESFRLSHASSFSSGLSRLFAKPIFDMFSFKPPFPEPINHLWKYLDVFTDFDQHLFSPSQKTALFRGLDLVDLGKNFPDDFPTSDYSPIITYFENFAAKPVACIVTETPKGTKFRRPGGVSVTFQKSGDHAAFFRYEPEYSVWGNPGFWNEETRKIMPRLSRQDTPQHIIDLFGTDHKNVIAMTGAGLFVMTPAQYESFANSGERTPAQYARRIAYDFARSTRTAPRGQPVPQQ